MTLARTTPDECVELGRMIANKLNSAVGPTALFIPTRGVSLISTEGQPFHDPQADQSLVDALRQNIDASHVEVHEIDIDINAPEFALAMADGLHARSRNLAGPRRQPRPARTRTTQRLPLTNYHSRDTTRPRRDAVARLQRACSGPVCLERSRSSWPRSHGSPGRISPPHLAHGTATGATNGDQPPPASLVRLTVATSARSPTNSHDHDLSVAIADDGEGNGTARFRTSGGLKRRP